MEEVFRRGSRSDCCSSHKDVDCLIGAACVEAGMGEAGRGRLMAAEVWIASGNNNRYLYSRLVISCR